MTAAKKVLEDCQRDEPLNLERSRLLFKELSKATDEYVRVVDEYIARGRSLHDTNPPTAGVSTPEAIPLPSKPRRTRS
jgi:hypothetical protein